MNEFPFDDPALASTPYVLSDVDAIELARGKKYERLRVTVGERDLMRSELNGVDQQVAALTTERDVARADRERTDKQCDVLLSERRDLRLRLIDVEQERDSLKRLIADNARDEGGRVSMPLAGLRKLGEAREQVVELTSIVTDLSRQIESGGSLWSPDHACMQCVPHSDLLIQGFVCARHQAKALVKS